MSTLAFAEVRLRDRAGYRGQPDSEFALSGEDCKLIAEELDRLRALLKKGQADARDGLC
jgi:hypothetical protein